MEQTLLPYEARGLRFMARPGTSDKKGIDEVMGGGYRRTRPFAFDVMPGEEWLDLGAMIGAFSAYAIMRGASKVTAVEPDPDHIKILRMNAATADIKEGAIVLDGREKILLNRNDKRGNTWRNSVMREWQGGSKVEVPAFHVSTLISPGTCVKMDIEGMEMPVLEWLLSEQGKAALEWIPKLVFEWSFDVDPDLTRFRAVMLGLQRAFPNVAPMKLYEGYDQWPKSWFPACATIFCMR